MDRNAVPHTLHEALHRSLSARRAWIEMSNGSKVKLAMEVALRKESVDRNTQKEHPLTKPIESLSARRAWIEMALIRYLINTYHRRSPQGERG